LNYQKNNPKNLTHCHDMMYKSVYGAQCCEIMYQSCAEYQVDQTMGMWMGGVSVLGDCDIKTGEGCRLEDIRVNMSFFFKEETEGLKINTANQVLVWSTVDDLVESLTTSEGYGLGQKSLIGVDGKLMESSTEPTKNICHESNTLRKGQNKAGEYWFDNACGPIKDIGFVYCKEKHKCTLDTSETEGKFPAYRCINDAAWRDTYTEYATYNSDKMEAC